MLEAPGICLHWDKWILIVASEESVQWAYIKVSLCTCAALKKKKKKNLRCMIYRYITNQKGFVQPRVMRL